MKQKLIANKKINEKKTFYIKKNLEILLLYQNITQIIYLLNKLLLMSKGRIK